ncbi:MAG: hypothetical protein KME64_36135 [Scytonematopsis contorta HA4267-MV1]|jgi:hypothetical protein|nr:hypothetical protein [Scytonematopsis contorta HA4267-MV1]
MKQTKASLADKTANQNRFTLVNQEVKKLFQHLSRQLTTTPNPKAYISSLL